MPALHWLLCWTMLALLKEDKTVDLGPWRAGKLVFVIHLLAVMIDWNSQDKMAHPAQKVSYLPFQGGTLELHLKG